ncbi:uncharacterized protein A4U43_C08F4570 [Asparagus officinalis]|nr:uncharacterized protein A4U43_C08F4570 [Asparagus officinalis]
MDPTTGLRHQIRSRFPSSGSSITLALIPCHPRPRVHHRRPRSLHPPLQIFPRSQIRSHPDPNSSDGSPETRPSLFEISIAAIRRQNRDGLYSDVTPRTPRIFRALCTGEKARHLRQASPLQGSAFHRVIPGFMCPGRRFIAATHGFESVYGEHFEDENFERGTRGGGPVDGELRAPTRTGAVFICTERGGLARREARGVGEVVEGMES